MQSEKNLFWMKMGFTDEALNKITRLDQLHCHAVSVWLRTLMLLCQNRGRMHVRLLMFSMIGNHISKSKVREILELTGDVIFSDQDESVVLSQAALERYIPALMRNSSHENEVSCENSRAKTPSIAYACIDDKENKENKDNKENNIKKKESIRKSVSDLLTHACLPQEKSFYQGMLEHYPRICMMEDPLTYEQVDKVRRKGFSDEQIRNVLCQMENYRQLNTRYISAYLTLLNWLRK